MTRTSRGNFFVSFSFFTLVSVTVLCTNDVQMATYNSFNYFSDHHLHENVAALFLNYQISSYFVAKESSDMNIKELSLFQHILKNGGSKLLTAKHV